MDAGALLGVGERELTEVARHQLRDQVLATRATPAKQVLLGHEDTTVARLPAARSTSQTIEFFGSHQLHRRAGPPRSCEAPAPKVMRAGNCVQPTESW